MAITSKTCKAKFETEDATATAVKQGSITSKLKLLGKETEFVINVDVAPFTTKAVT